MVALQRSSYSAASKFWLVSILMTVPLTLYMYHPRHGLESQGQSNLYEQVAPGVWMPLINFGTFIQGTKVYGGPDSYVNITRLVQAGAKGLNVMSHDPPATHRQFALELKWLLDSGMIQRKQLFISVFVKCEHDAAEILDRLGLEYADMLGQHNPCPDAAFRAGEETSAESTLTNYQTLEALHKAGRARSLAVANYIGTKGVASLRGLLEDARVAPVANQIEMSIDHPLPTSDLAWFRKHGIKVMAFSPLGLGMASTPLLTNPVVMASAKAHGKAPVHVALRWIVQQKLAFVTASTNYEHVRSDLELDFELTDEEMTKLTSLNA